MNKKTKVLILATGIPTFIGTGLFEFLVFRNLGTAVLVGLVGSVLVSLFLFLISFGFIRIDRKVKKVTIGHFLLLSVAGIIITGLYYFLAQYAPVGQWIEVAPPPEQIVHFLPSADPTIFGYSLFVKGKSGTIYSYDCETYQECNWVQREYTPDKQDSFDISQMALRKRLIPFPPGRIIERQHQFGKGPDFETGVMFIRLADERIFYWTQFYSVYESVFMVFGFSLTGFITGLSASISILILRTKRTQIIN